VHLPLLVRVPGVGGGRIPGYVLNTQVAATIEELAGLPLDRRVKAVSLLEVARQQHGLAQFPFLAWPSGHGRHGAREGQYKLLTWEDGGVRLYDEVADPLERTDVSQEHPDVVERLKAPLVEPVHPDGGHQMDPKTREMLKRGGYLREDGKNGR
jgi:arylsulfatase A-like enzyme